MGSSPTQQRLSSTLDLDIGRLSPVSLESMRLTNSCLVMIGSENTICQSIGLPGKWNSDGARRSLALWFAPSHMSPPPPTGQLLFWKFSDRNTSTSSPCTGLE